jgi:threonine-phosphate decarboxylase
VHEYTLTAESDFTIDISHLLESVRRLNNLGGIVLGSPNNPTGRLCDNKTILELLGYCESKNIYLIVDETFIEFAGLEYSLTNKVKQSNVLILVQSLTKFYALAGLRVGHGISSKHIADKIRAIRPPWSVNAPAQSIGSAVVKDIEYQKRTREFIKAEYQHLHRNLYAIKSIDVFSSHANFLLFRLREQDANPHELYANLLQDGALTRNCANFKGLSAGYFRVAVKNRTENDTLLSLLNKYL